MTSVVHNCFENTYVFPHQGKLLRLCPGEMIFDEGDLSLVKNDADAIFTTPLGREDTKATSQQEEVTQQVDEVPYVLQDFNASVDENINTTSEDNNDENRVFMQEENFFDKVSHDPLELNGKSLNPDLLIPDVNMLVLSMIDNTQVLIKWIHK